MKIPSRKSKKGNVSDPFGRWRQQSLLLLLIALQGVLAPVLEASEEAPVKRLKRLHPYQMGGQIDDHHCTRERVYREEDYLAALTDKEIAEYEAMANKGDAEAMYLLALIGKETPDGRRNYPYRETWLPRAAEAGQPIARYLLAQEKHKRKEMADYDFIALAEAAALAQGSGEIAWRMSHAYLDGDEEPSNTFFERPRPFRFLEQNPQKALHWARIAAGKGNMMAAERLCVSYINGNYRLAIDKAAPESPGEAARWCTLAAQAMCSSSAAANLEGMYKSGYGVPRSLLDALYWKKIFRGRYYGHGRAVSIDKWEYIGE